MLRQESFGSEKKSTFSLFKNMLLCHTYLIKSNSKKSCLQALNDEFAAMTKKKKDLEDNIELCSQKLDRAEKLIYGLGGERDRWSDMAQDLGSRLINITGDVLLASGVVAYLVKITIILTGVRPEDSKS